MASDSNLLFHILTKVDCPAMKGIFLSSKLEMTFNELSFSCAGKMCVVEDAWVDIRTP